jgi:hypothetical protein
MSILRFPKWFDVDASSFQIEPSCRCFGFFDLATVLATSYKYLGHPSKYSSHPVPEKILK